MIDSFNRGISYLRISLTDRCNFRCIYCMPQRGVEKINHNQIMSLEDVFRVVKVAEKYGINKIRLTGGEPLIRKGIVDLCQKISSLDGIKQLCITTNGSLFKNMAKELKNAGVDGVNFSLDTLDKEKFKKITRGAKLEDTIESIELAMKLGFKVKINSVLIGGFNTDDIYDLVEYTKDNNIQVRFIELMKLGETIEWESKKFISNDIVLKKVPRLKKIRSEGVAQIYEIEGYRGSVGLISPISSCFCSQCNRIRLTSNGKLKPCLHSEKEIDLNNLTDEELEETFVKAIFHKPEKHNLIEGSTNTKRFMNSIGG